MICRRRGKRFWQRGSLLFLVNACLWASDCRREPQHAWPVGEVVVDGLSGDGDANLTQATLRELLYTMPGVEAVAHGPSCTHGPEPLIIRGALGAGLLPASQTPGVLLQLEVGPSLGTGRQFAVTVPMPGLGTQAAQLRAGVCRAWTQLAELRSLDDAGDGALVQAAQVPSPAARALRQQDDGAHLAQVGRIAFALRRIGERQIRAATPQVCQWLAHADTEDADEADRALALHAVGTLVALGDRRAVAPIINLAQRKEASWVMQLAYAVAALGGPLAEGYLVTLGSGHPDPDVRQGAAAALADMLAQSDGAQLRNHEAAGSAL